MHAVELLASALGRPEGLHAEQGVCCLTGRSGPSVPRKTIIKKSFTNLDVLAAPGSDRVSVDAFVALGHKWERMSSWICTGSSFRRLDRIGVREAVFDPPSEPWCAYATTSYKKHGALFARVNTGGSRWWRFENLDVDCANPMMPDIWARLNVEIRTGLPRTMLERVDCPAGLLKRIGVERWLRFRAWAEPLKARPVYRFMVYLLPSQEELKAEPRSEEAEQPSAKKSRPSNGKITRPTLWDAL